MAFKLGSESRNIKNSSNTKIFKKKLGDGIMGEANSDGSIYIDVSVPKDQIEYFIVVLFLCLQVSIHPFFLSFSQRFLSQLIV